MRPSASELGHLDRDAGPRGAPPDPLAKAASCSGRGRDPAAAPTSRARARRAARRRARRARTARAARSARRRARSGRAPARRARAAGQHPGDAVVEHLLRDRAAVLRREVEEGDPCGAVGVLVVPLLDAHVHDRARRRAPRARCAAAPSGSRPPTASSGVTQSRFSSGSSAMPSAARPLRFAPRPGLGPRAPCAGLRRRGRSRLVAPRRLVVARPFGRAAVPRAGARAALREAPACSPPCAPFRGSPLLPPSSAAPRFAAAPRPPRRRAARAAVFAPCAARRASSAPRSPACRARRRAAPRAGAERPAVRRGRRGRAPRRSRARRAC